MICSTTAEAAESETPTSFGLGEVRESVGVVGLVGRRSGETGDSGTVAS